MATPPRPVMLSAKELEEFLRKMGEFRHEVNNHLTLIVAAAELIRRSPDAAPRVASTLAEQPRKISEALSQFATEVNRLLQGTRPPNAP